MWRGSHRRTLAAATVAPRRVRFSLHQRGWFGRASASSDSQEAPIPTVDPERQAAAKMALRHFKQVFQRAEGKELMRTWDALLLREPVIFGSDRMAVATDSDRAHPDIVAVRMLTLPKLLELTRLGARDQVVERLYRSGRKEPLPITEDRVVQVSEELVVWEMLVALAKCKDDRGRHTVMKQHDQHVAALSVEDRNTIADYEQGNPKAAKSAAKFREFLDVTDLTVFSAQHGDPAQIVARAKRYQDDLKPFILKPQVFKFVMEACSKQQQQDGAFARTLIDQAMDRHPVAIVNSYLFRLAIHANLHGMPKSAERLHTAMHIYRRMRDEAGYILRPDDWSKLFNSCVYLDETELALEVFRDYRAHGIAPFQKARFQRALGIVIYKQNYSLLVEMAREWIQIEARPRAHPLSIPPAQLLADEGECLNRILWGMLEAPTALPRAKIEELLALMQQRRIQAGGWVMRKLVAQVLAGDEDVPPSITLSRFFTLTEQYAAVRLQSRQVLYLLLEQCIQRGWTDQLERVIQHSQQHAIQLPTHSIGKLLEGLVAKGELDTALALGQLVLKAIPPEHEGAGAIPDTFFEGLLRCLAFQQRFREILEIDAAYRVMEVWGTRAPALAAIVKDAKESES